MPFTRLGCELCVKSYFPIGGETVTCHKSKLINSQGQTKLTNAYGKQHLEYMIG